jgi:hypothetical protein
MKNSRIHRAILLISGLIATGVGGALLLAPVAFHAGNGIDLGGQISLLNEVRAGGGALLACGVLIICGAFVTRLTFAAAVVSPVLYLSYGMARILSLALDGFPAEGLLTAMVVEVAIGMVGVFSLVKFQGTHETAAPSGQEDC